MKRLLFIFSLFHFFVATAVAQVGDYRTDLAIGGSAGCVMSNVGFVPDVPQSMLMGYTAGLSVRYTCEKYFSSVCSIVVRNPNILLIISLILCHILENIIYNALIICLHNCCPYPHRQGQHST